MQKFDVSKHVLVPKHVKVNEKEKNDVLEKYSAGLNDLPRINANDSALAGLDVKEGDVIKIVRTSPTAGESIFYRRVSRG